MGYHLSLRNLTDIHRTAEQIERDIVSAKKTIEDARKSTGKLRKEQDSVTSELKGVEVRSLSRRSSSFEAH